MIYYRHIHILFEVFFRYYLIICNYYIFRTLIAELQHKVMSLQMECMEHKQALESSKSSGDASIQIQQQLDATKASLLSVQSEKDALSGTVSSLEAERAELRARCDELSRLREEDSSASQRRIAELQEQHEQQLQQQAAASASASANANASTASDLAELEELRAKLLASESTVASLNQALESVAAKSVEAADQNQATISALELQLANAKAETEAAVAKADNAIVSAGAGAGGKADADELKSIMQDVYVKACEVFDSEAPESADVQYTPQDIVKRIRGVLKKVTNERSTA